MVTIGAKIETGAYKTLRELESDLTLLFVNAKTYDEHANLPEDRFVTRDANALQLAMLVAITHIAQQKAQKKLKPATQWKSAYLHFCDAMRPQLPKNLSFRETGVELGRRWKLLTDEDKQPYEALSLESRRQVQERLARHQLQERLAAQAQAATETHFAAQAAAVNESNGQTRAQGGKTKSELQNSLQQQLGSKQPVASKSDRVTMRMHDAIEVIRACKDNGRQLCSFFEKLPSRQELPDYYRLIEKPKLPLREENPHYYEVIKEPMDLETVYRNIVSGKTYSSWEQFEAHMQLIFANARLYHPPGSEIYEHATTLSALMRRLRPDEEKARLLQLEKIKREKKKTADQEG